MRTAAMARRHVDDAVEVLRRLVPLALKLTRVVGAYVVLVAAAATIIVVTLTWRFWSGSLFELLGYVVLAGILFGPVAMLWLFYRALREAVQIPERLDTMPDVAREHGTELAALVRAAQARRGGTRLTSLPGDLWRAGRLLLAAHEDLLDYGGVLRLISVPFLVTTLASACIGVAYVVLVPVVVAGSVLTAVF